jgi:hypothetical protein
MKPIGCLKTSPRNVHEERRIHLRRRKPDILFKDFSVFKQRFICIYDKSLVRFFKKLQSQLETQYDTIYDVRQDSKKSYNGLVMTQHSVCLKYYTPNDTTLYNRSKI